MFRRTIVLILINIRTGVNLKRIIFCFIVVFIFILPCFASESFIFENPSSIQLEVRIIEGFPMYSFNYELILLNGNKFKTLASLGFARYPSGMLRFDKQKYFNVAELFSFNKHHLETGFEYTTSPTTNYGDMIMISYKLGYRFQKPQGKFLFKVFYKPFYIFGGNARPGFDFLSGSVSVGYAFSIEKILNGIFSKKGSDGSN